MKRIEERPALKLPSVSCTAEGKKIVTSAAPPFHSTVGLIRSRIYNALHKHKSEKTRPGDLVKKDRLYNEGFELFLEVFRHVEKGRTKLESLSENQKNILEQSNEFMTAAADHGSTAAMNHLGTCFLFGIHPLLRVAHAVCFYQGMLLPRASTAL